MDNSPLVSIIVPTYREEANLRPLVTRIAAAMESAGRSCEVLIVDDDSRDGTDVAVRELAERYPVRLITRTGQRDLSLAVLEGMRQARGQILLIMDADLSHPPEQIPELLRALEQPPTDFVIGSRYVPGGETEAGWGIFRRLNSLAATLLCRPLVGRVTDPMAGFFALRRDTFVQADRLDPIGYKIGLELICRCRCRHVREVPISFANRAGGQSKLNLDQQARYLVHLGRLYRSYARGWGLVIRPILAVMRAGIAVVRCLRPDHPDAATSIPAAVRKNRAA
ncbi:MAG: polyprenol monophosphomannose synthase [Phycisphaerae bacterium]